MQCHHFDAGRCRSCTWIERPYATQLADKERHCRELLGPMTGLTWLEPVASAESAFRNKAKMVVAGTLPEPTLGILDPVGGGVDLRDCGLHAPLIQAALPVLADFVTHAALTPYDVRARRGELKHLLVTASPDGELMVRFVLRSTESLARIRKHLPGLLERLPALAAASVNLQPHHKAVLEGADEIALTERETLPMAVNGLVLHLRPQSFFQTNTEVAAALYRQGREWVEEAAPRTVWDLYCGVGGFALHVAAPGREVIGVETSTEAVASASLTATESGLDGVRFVADDATAYALAAPSTPDLVVVNPPRRGIGPELAGWLETSGVRHVVYSSCNAVSLAKDLAAMPSLRPVRARVLDMFPQTAHYEVIVLLERRP
ncbi:23S rRNA (uracil(747)-C(5))-methyltransferase RlmC [Nocardioides sp. zg-DK7169]|uniref:23S rRNA (uracil(747)-C(5))-methyltransferase RlmC n=1 Tax=Nocardioides sp. zg-DK7169 TaxID=2736600 RepID=UPI00155506E8|nr:23S rRNA (uracil(747)-C(5))-methyltransferase RlmC [Nocardioides sp. zg-DK7169]NPC97452.1 23S rRNA (uracil(747)-C(5))-methyltransferase RlmC [Nocardioides sp. zg-DK7169]